MARVAAQRPRPASAWRVSPHVRRGRALRAVRRAGRTGTGSGVIRGRRGPRGSGGFALLRSSARQGCRSPGSLLPPQLGLLFCVAALRRGEHSLQLRPQVFRQSAPLVVRVAGQYRPFIGRYRVGSDVAAARQRNQRQAVQCLDAAALGRSRVPVFRFEVIAPDLLVKLAETKLSLDTSPSGIRFPFDFELYDVALPEGLPLRGGVGACGADRNHRGEDGDRRTPSEAIEKFAHYGNQIPLNGTSPARPC